MTWQPDGTIMTKHTNGETWTKGTDGTEVTKYANGDTEGKILLAMFALMLTSIGLIVLGTEPSKVLDLALLARIFFVLSLVCLIVRIYLHGKE